MTARTEKAENLSCSQKKAKLCPVVSAKYTLVTNGILPLHLHIRDPMR